MSKIYVVSDIHGCFDELMCVLDAAQFNPSAGDVLYILGDIIDRGLSTSDAVRWLINQPRESVKFLIGNHELMMMEATRGDWENMQIIGFFDNPWGLNGGYDTAEAMYFDLTSDERRQFFELIENSPLLQRVTVNGDEFLLTHAGLTPYEWMMVNTSSNGGSNKLDDVSISQWLVHQSREYLLWVREEWLGNITALPFYVVTGHTIFPSVVDRIRHEFGDNPMRRDLRGYEHYIDVENSNSPLRMVHDEARVLTWNGRIAIDGGCRQMGKLLLLCLNDGVAYYAPLQERGVINTLENMMDTPAEDWGAMVAGDHWGVNTNNIKVQRARTILGGAYGKYPGIVSKYLSKKALGLLNFNTRNDVTPTDRDPFAVVSERVIYSPPNVAHCPLLRDSNANIVEAILYNGEVVLRTS